VAIDALFLMANVYRGVVAFLWRGELSWGDRDRVVAALAPPLR